MSLTIENHCLLRLFKSSIKFVFIFALLFIFSDNTSAQVNNGPDPGPNYGCLISFPAQFYRVYSGSYTFAPWNATMPEFTNAVTVINNSNGSNSYTCGLINRGFTDRPNDYPDSGSGNCHVQGMPANQFGSLKFYTINNPTYCSTSTPAPLPLDDYIPIGAFGLGLISFFILRDKITFCSM